MVDDEVGDFIGGFVLFDFGQKAGILHLIFALHFVFSTARRESL